MDKARSLGKRGSLKIQKLLSPETLHASSTLMDSGNLSSKDRDWDIETKLKRYRKEDKGKHIKGKRK